MPRIPVYQPGTVQDTALPGVRQTGGATTEMFEDSMAKGAGVLGRGLQQAGGAVIDILTDQQKTLNADAVTRAEVAHKDEESQYRIELAQRKGINGATVATDASKWWDEKQRKAVETLENDAQRRAYTRLMSERRATFMDFAYKHQAVEIQNAWAESKTANINASIKASAAAGGDETVMAQERSRIEGALQDIAGRLGWDKEKTDQERATYVGKMHDLTINTLLADDPRKAKAYLDKYGAELKASDPAKYDDLTNKVRKGTIETDGRIMAESAISAGYNGGIKLIKDEKEKAKEIQNPGERDYRMDVLEKAEAFHAREFAHREQQKNYNQRNAAEQAYTLLRQGKDVPLTIRNAMDPRAAMALEKDMAGGKEKAETDWAAYALLRKEARENPEEFGKRDLYKYFGVLAPKERETLIDLQGQIAKAKPEKIKHIQSLEAFITGYAADNKLYNKGDTQEDYWKFENTVKEQLQRVAKSKGKAIDELTDDDYKQAADWAVMKESSRFVLPERPRYKVRGTEDAAKFNPERAVYIDDVPKSDKDKIIEQYRREKGAFPPHAKIIEIYNLQKKGKK